MRTPADKAASPLAMAVVATEAISHGASPTHITPSRSDPALTIRETSHDSAGRTVAPTIRVMSRGRHDAAARRRAAGSIVTAVENTRTISRALMPLCEVNQASGR